MCEGSTVMYSLPREGDPILHMTQSKNTKGKTTTTVTRRVIVNPPGARRRPRRARMQRVSRAQSVSGLIGPESTGFGRSVPGGMNASVAYGTTTLSTPPRISSSPKSMVVCQRELVLGSVAGSTTFTVQSFLNLNPGLSAVFPWLSKTALNWEQYVVKQLWFRWVPITGTATAGDVILSPNYDASDPQPTTESQAVNNFGTITFPCWQPQLFKLDTQAMMASGPRRFVRQTAVAGDIKTFDVGTLAVCTNNQSGTSAIGKLFVEYCFEFHIPQNDPSTGTVPLYTSYFTRTTSNQSYTTTVGQVVNWNNSVFDPLSFGPGSSGTFTPPAGCYRIFVQLTGTESVVDATTLQLQFRKNAAALIQGPASAKSLDNGGSEAVSVSAGTVIPFNGTDTFDVFVTMIGTGTLALSADFCQLIVSLA